MNPHLFLFTVGPVQSFIAQARKTQDLYAGSQILGQLILEAARVAQENEIRFIYPGEIKQGLPIPNRFLAKIKGKSSQELQKIGYQVEEAVRDKFRNLAWEAIDASKIDDFSKVEKAFWQQVNKHLEINWLFHPIGGEDDASYRLAYKEIECLMGSLKNIRVFDQFDYNLSEDWRDSDDLNYSERIFPGEAGRKCSLDGERNALFFGNGTEGSYAGQGIKLKKELVQVDSNEGLSAIGLVKRFFKLKRNFRDDDRRKFRSTAEVAILNVIKRTNGIFEIYKTCLGNHEWDAQLCFKENLTERYLRKNGYEDVLAKCDISTLLTCWESVFNGKPTSSYYALVAFDGDRMGEILSGAPSFFKGNNLEEYQGKVSMLLSSFAKKAESYIQNSINAGEVAYTGGDDFLGFINLEDLFEVMSWLRNEFHNQVSAELKKDGYFHEGKDFTFSAGIAVAHYKTPLGIVLNKGREMERLAKSAKGGDRDSFAISVIKKSGESHETCYKWELSRGLLHLKAIDELIGYFEDGYCSETFLRNFIREFSVLQDNEGNITSNGMVEMELARLVKRSMTEKGKKENGKVKEVLKTLENLMPINNDGRERNFNFQNLSDAISIALFLKRNRKKQN